MKNGCWLALVPLLAATGLPAITGCDDPNSSLSLKPKQNLAAKAPAKPVQTTGGQAGATDGPVQGTSGPVVEAPADATAADGSTAEAVRQFLADLDAASIDQPAEEPRTTAEGPRSSAGARTARANESLTLAEEAAQTASAQPVAALPVVLAVSLVGGANLSSESSDLRSDISDSRSGISDSSAPVDEPPTVGVHRGMDTSIPEGESSLDRLVERAKEELSADPANGEKQWRLSLLQLAAGRPADAGELSPELAQEARTLTAHMVQTVSSVSRMLAEPATGAEEALSAVNELRGLLRERAELSVPVVALCTRVTTFGVYEEMAEDALLPYQANRVIVYIEIANFSTEDSGPQGRHAQLSTRLELLTASGRSVWLHEEERIEDYSKRGREDFFLAQLVTFPADLGPGEYVLKAAVTDALAAKTNEGVLRFRIGGGMGAGAGAGASASAAP